MKTNSFDTPVFADCNDHVFDRGLNPEWMQPERSSVKWIQSLSAICILLALPCVLLLSPDARAQWTSTSQTGQTQLTTGSAPSVLAVAKSARIMAVGNEGSKSVSFHHPDSGTLLGNTTLPSAALSISLSDDGSRAYALYGSGINIAVINTSTRAILSTWRTTGAPVSSDAGAGQGMALNAARAELLVLDASARRLVVFSTQTGAVLRTKTLSTTPSLVAVSGSGVVMVGHENGQLLMLAADTLATTRSVSVGDELRALASWQGGSGERALAVTRDQDALAIIDPANGQLTRVPLTDKSESLSVEQQDNWAYVSLKDAESVALIDLVKQVLSGHYTLPGVANHLVFDSTAGVLLLAMKDNNRILRLDPAQSSLVRRLRIAAGLKEIAINPVTHQAVVVSEEVESVYRVDLGTRAVSARALGETAEKVAIDRVRNMAVIADDGERLQFVNLATTPPTLYAERISLSADVEAMAVDSSRGLTLVAVEDEARVLIVNNQTRSLLGSISLPEEVTAIAIHEGKGLGYLATKDGRLRLLNLATRTLGQVVNLGFEVKALAIDEELNLAVLLDDEQKRAVLFNLNSLQTVSSFVLPDEPEAVAIQPDTHLAVVLGGDEGWLSLIDLQAKTLVSQFNKVKEGEALAISVRYNQAWIISDEDSSLSIVQLPADVPTLASIAPAEAAVGAASLVVTINGGHFIEGSVVLAGATELATTWVSPTRLTAVLPATLLATPGSLVLKVFTPGPGGGYSGAMNFTVKYPVPVLESLIPDSAVANSQPKTITLTGQNFYAPTQVEVNGTLVDAAITGSTKAVVSLPGNLFAAAGNLALRIKTPGGVSNSRVLTITAPAAVPYIYTSAPATILAVGQARELTLSGFNFASGASVLVGPLASATVISTTFVNSQNLRFTLPASFSVQAAVLSVRVRNADGQVSSEYSLPVVAPDLVVAAIAPERGVAGSSITILGAGFSSTPSDNQVRFGGGALAVVESASATSLKVTVPATATTGAVQVSVGGRSVTGPVFTVGETPKEDYAFGANSAELTVHQSSTASVDVKLSSAGVLPFTGLAKLSVSGLPGGVSAKFTRPYLTGGGNATLVLTAESAAAVGSSVLTITAAGDVGATSASKFATVRLTVKSAATGVKGRFVDRNGNGIGGVLVRFDPASGPGHSAVQVQSDSSGNFVLTGMPAGATTLRMDATPAHPLFPIWPYLVTVEQGKMLTLPDWTIVPPPADNLFKPISESPQAQEITDDRFPGLKITIPANTSIVGYDGIKKTRIAVERHDPDKSPTVAPPISTRSVYQLYFGTPMGGIPTQPIPVTLPNETDLEAGEKTEIWYFDGSPMGGEGQWKVAGTATVSADRKTVVMDAGQGIPRFCGVCGQLCVKDREPKGAPEPAPGCHPPAGGGGSGGSGSGQAPVCKAGNPVQLSNGQESPTATDFTLSGLVPVSVSRYFNTVDAFNNRAGTVGSLGYSWGFEYDVVLLPFQGPEKRIIMPGNQKVSFFQQANGTFANSDNFRFQGAVLRQTSFSNWELELADKTVWKFLPFAGITGQIFGGVPLFLTEQRSPNGQVLNIARLPNGRATSVGTAERQLTLAYGSNGFVSEISDPLNRKVRYTYTASGRIETVTNPEGGVTRYEYGSYSGDYPIVPPAGQTHDPVCIQTLNDSTHPDLGLPLKSIQYPGTIAKTLNTLGHGGRVLRQVLADGSEYRFRYTIIGGCRAANPNLPFAIRTCSALNDACEQSYERAQRGEHVFGGAIAAVVVTDPKGRETIVRFTPRGAASEQSDEQGQPANFKRDSVGRVIESTDVLGRTVKNSFDAAGNVSRMIDSLGRITDMTYDTRWNKLATLTRYLDNGAPVTTSNIYDASTGNLASTTSPEGHTTTFTYTSRGQVSTVTNPLGHTTRFDYNPAGDLIKVTDPLNNEVRMEPDLAGRIQRITDPLSFVTRIERNGLDQTTKIIDADQGETVLAYNTKHQLASLTDPLGQVVERYEYDDLYRPIQRTDASNKVETTRYDLSGQADRHTDRKGQVTSSTFDEKDRPVTTTFADGSTLTRTYDAVGRLVKLVRAGAGLEETFTYRLDNADRLTELTRVAGSRTDTVTYQYDNLDRVIKRLVNGEATEYSYDKSGRLQTILHKGQTTRYTWDAASRLVEKTLPNNLKQQMVYDNASRLTSLIYKSAANTIIEQIDYGYDARGQRTSMSTLGIYPAARDTPIEASYNSANRLTSLTLKGVGANNGDETYTFTYDDNGNLTEKRGQGAVASNVTTYTWDKHNRLTGLTQTGTDAITATFSYDVFGRRTSKTLNGNKVTYVYDGDQAVGEEANGTTTSQLTGLAIDEHIARYSGQDQLIYLTDALGSIMAQAKADGTLQNKYGYSPYGQVASDGDDKQNPHQYTGRENDKTGLYYYRARYYMPGCGRFISEDPIGTAGGTNIYAYVNGNPISLVDPSGEFGLVGAAIGFGLDVALQLAMNGGRLECVSWTQAGIAGALGAVGGGAIAGAFKHSVSGKRWLDSANNWSNVSRRYRRAHDVPKDHEVHHWLIERNSAIGKGMDNVLGKRMSDSIKNHPWNLNPVSKPQHAALHEMGPVARTVLGAPEWAQAAGASVGAGVTADLAKPNGGGCD